MKNRTLIILGLIGVGLYFYLKKKKPNVADLTVTNLPPATPQTNLVTNENPVSMVSNDAYNVHFALSGMKKLGKIPNTI